MQQATSPTGEVVHGPWTLGRFDTAVDAAAAYARFMRLDAAGRWQEVEAVFYSWEPDDRGRLHWNSVRTHMCGGRLVRVQATKHNTVNYYKQASRAGEGFGNRSSARFLHETSSFVGPGKYTPDPQGAPKASGYTGGNHSGKLKSTGPRFLKSQSSDAPGPGKYKSIVVGALHSLGSRLDSFVAAFARGRG